MQSCNKAGSDHRSWHDRFKSDRRFQYCRQVGIVTTQLYKGLIFRCRSAAAIAVACSAGALTGMPGWQQGSHLLYLASTMACRSSISACSTLDPEPWSNPAAPEACTSPAIGVLAAACCSRVQVTKPSYGSRLPMLATAGCDRSMDIFQCMRLSPVDVCSQHSTAQHSTAQHSRPLLWDRLDL